MPTENSTSYHVESVFVESLKANCRTQNIDHFQSDVPNGWPLVSVKATLAEEDPAQIKYEGNPCEIYNVYIVAEYPVNALSEPVGDTPGHPISADEVDLLSREVRLSISAAGESESMSQFVYFEIDPLSESEKDIEDSANEVPSRRVDIASFRCVVIRG